MFCTNNLFKSNMNLRIRMINYIKDMFTKSKQAKEKFEKIKDKYYSKCSNKEMIDFFIELNKIKNNYSCKELTDLLEFSKLKIIETNNNELKKITMDLLKEHPSQLINIINDDKNYSLLTKNHLIKKNKPLTEQEIISDLYGSFILNPLSKTVNYFSCLF